MILKFRPIKVYISASIHESSANSRKLTILCPGYVDSKDYFHLVKLAEELQKLGYVVVRFNPTGTWNSSGEISDHNHTQYLNDIDKVISYMLKKNKFSEILVGVHSMGAQVSILCSADYSSISNLLVIMSPYKNIKGDMQKMWEKTNIRISDRDLLNNPNEKIKFIVPYSYAMDINKFDVLNSARKIKSYILFIAGEKDEIVPVKDLKNIYNEANQPKKFILIPEIGHDYRHNEKEVAQVNKLIKQLLS